MVIGEVLRMEEYREIVDECGRDFTGWAEVFEGDNTAADPRAASTRATVR
jgi:hypothetical protein